MNIDFQINTICNFLRENAISCKKTSTQLHDIFTENRAYNFIFYLKDKKILTASAKHFHYDGWTPFVVNMDETTFYIDPQTNDNKKYKILDGFFNQINAIATELYYHNNNKNFLKMFH